MVATKARVGIKQYMKAKPTEWGLKFFLFLLSTTAPLTSGCTLVRTSWHRGRGSPLMSWQHSWTRSSWVRLHNLLRHLYTSFLLFRHLSQQGFGACGTYRQGRTCVPSTQEDAIDKRSPRGTVDQEWWPPIYKMDGHKRCLHLHIHPPCVQWGHCVMVAKERSWYCYDWNMIYFVSWIWVMNTYHSLCYN